MRLDELKEQLTQADDEGEDPESSIEEDLTEAIYLLDQVVDLLNDCKTFFPYRKQDEAQNCLVDIEEFLDGFEIAT